MYLCAYAPACVACWKLFVQNSSCAVPTVTQTFSLHLHVSQSILEEALNFDKREGGASSGC